MWRSAAQMGRMCGADGANVRRRWGDLRRRWGDLRRRWVPSAAQMGFICAADVGICGADWTVFRRRFDVICGKVFSEPEDFSDRPFLRVASTLTHTTSSTDTALFIILGGDKLRE